VFAASKTSDVQYLRSRVIVALDEESLSDAEKLMGHLAGKAFYYKIGLQLFTSAGKAAVEAVKARGARIFLDLKLHDIPNTVASAVRSARNLGADMCTIHLAGGVAMCSAAVAEAGEKMKILGVSVLTSTDGPALKASGVAGDLADHVMRLADIGHASGVHGFVSSALEAHTLRLKFGQSKILVTPGVRPSGANANDQKRIVTPFEAAQRGADYVVIGRPVARAADPLDAFESIVSEISNAAKQGYVSRA
jgi:orotidine-5'-phosphate decarboxylase